MKIEEVYTPAYNNFIESYILNVANIKAMKH